MFFVITLCAACCLEDIAPNKLVGWAERAKSNDTKLVSLVSLYSWAVFIDQAGYVNGWVLLHSAQPAWVQVSPVIARPELAKQAQEVPDETPKAVLR